MKRVLDEKEKGEVLDFPGERVTGINRKVLSNLLHSEIPGKVLSGVIYFLSAFKGKESVHSRSEPVSAFAYLRAKDSRNEGKSLEKGITKRVLEVDPVTVLPETSKRPSKRVRFSASEAPLNHLKGWQHLLEEDPQRYCGMDLEPGDILAEPEISNVSDKATKADDAEVPVTLWNGRILDRLDPNPESWLRMCAALDTI